MKINLLTQYFALLLLGTAALVSCKPKNPDPDPDPQTTLEMKFQLVYNGEFINLDQPLTTAEGYPLQIKEMKLILTQIKNNDLTLLDACKMDIAASGNSLFKAVGMPNDFKNLQGAIGVVQPWNNADPVSFPIDSPLYLSNVNDMHWGWNPGYIFYKFEGVFSPNVGSSSLTEIFTYHLGMNQYRKYFNFENIQWTKVADYKYEATVFLHVDDIFNGPGGVIDMVAEPFSHATPDKAELNEKFATNFAHALRVQ